MNPEFSVPVAAEALPAGHAVTVAYLACGKTKYAVLAPTSHPARAARGRLPHVFLAAGTKLIRRGLTSTGAERVANRVNAVAVAIQRLA